MMYKKLLERLRKECPNYYEDEPIFIDEIYRALEGYSKQGIFNFVNKAINKGDLNQISRGVYSNNINAKISDDEIAERKYIKKDNKIFGIYGCLYMEVNFGISNQIPNSIDIISNNASRKYRELFINNRKVLLRKSRCKITEKNYCEYTLLEFFNNYDIRQYSADVKTSILEYIKENKIKNNSIIKLSEYFPSKAIKNLLLSGVNHAFI